MILKGNDRRFFSSDKLGIRLSKTFCFYKDELHYLRGVHDGVIMEAVNCKTGTTVLIDSNDTDLDMEAPLIGWYNHGRHGPCYSYRETYRQQHAGIAYHSVTVFVPGYRISPISSSKHRLCDLFEYPQVAKMVAGEDMTEFSKAIADGGAVSRDLAFFKYKSTTLLYYHARIVGYCRDKQVLNLLTNDRVIVKKILSHISGSKDARQIKVSFPVHRDTPSIDTGPVQVQDTKESGQELRLRDRARARVSKRNAIALG